MSNVQVTFSLCFIFLRWPLYYPIKHQVKINGAENELKLFSLRILIVWKKTYGQFFPLNYVYLCIQKKRLKKIDHINILRHLNTELKIVIVLRPS